MSHHPDVLILQQLLQLLADIIALVAFIRDLFGNIAATPIVA